MSITRIEHSREQNLCNHRNELESKLSLFRLFKYFYYQIFYANQEFNSKIA